MPCEKAEECVNYYPKHGYCQDEPCNYTCFKSNVVSPHTEQAEASSLSDLLYSGTGWYCTECETLCDMYEQGLTCCCGAPWENETINEKDYPTKWVKVAVEAKRI